MRYWVQYYPYYPGYTYEKTGSNVSEKSGYSDECHISTNKKEVLGTKGDTIFLLVGITGQCFFSQRFICNEVDEAPIYDAKDEDSWKYFAYGEGWFVDTSTNRGLKRAQLDRKPGFQEFRRYCNNFHGFREITGHPFVETLLEVSETCKPRGSPPPGFDHLDPNLGRGEEEQQNGMGRGKDKPQGHNIPTEAPLHSGLEQGQENETQTETSHDKKEIEEAAIAFITSHYKQRGWKVTSVESEKCGYDLRCRKAKDEIHVEVKGLSGNDEKFIITNNEVETAKQDHRWILAIVNAALTKPKSKFVFRNDFLKTYKLTPISYTASPKS